MGRLTIKQEIKQDLLKGRLQQQRNKHSDKLQDKQYIQNAGENFDKTQLLQKQYFYRYETYNDCLKTACRFVDWVRETGLEEKRLPVREYEKYIENYINHLVETGDKTPRTIAKERSQLGKVWLVDTDYIRVPPMKTESEKGRTPDKYYNMDSEKNSAASEFYKMVGARKGEYRFLDLNEIKQYQDQVERETGIKIRANSEGQVPNIYPVRNPETKLIDRVIVIHAKHGKTNVSEIMEKDRERITRIFESKEYRNYFYPSDHCNVHQCRREYAQALYREHAKPILELSREEMYICKDGSGRRFDREALSIVAQSLGHQPDDLFDTVHNYMR